LPGRAPAPDGAYKRLLQANLGEAEFTFAERSQIAGSPQNESVLWGDLIEDLAQALECV